MIVTPWHNEDQLEQFLAAWNILDIPDYLILQKDTDKEGCARTKNKGIEKALSLNPDIIVILDDDCYPSEEAKTLEELLAKHRLALEPQPVELFEAVTTPASRGTPYYNRSIELPVAASMGFWLNVPDYDAVSQLTLSDREIVFHRKVIYQRYFPLSGMNLAFRPSWYPYCQFIDIPRFDDIWQGFIWQKKAYHDGYCFNLNGPLITHSRQSNIWTNLKQEVKHLEENEQLWSLIHQHPSVAYKDLIALIPQNDMQNDM